MAVLTLEVREHCATGDVSESEVEIFENAEVAGFDGEEDLFLQSLGHGGVKGELGEIGSELAVRFGDLRGSCVGCVDGRVAGMDGNGEGLAGAVDVSSSWHDDGEMAVGATSARGVDGASVGIELLLEELEGGVRGLARDMGEVRVWERECGRGSGRRTHGGSCAAGGAAREKGCGKRQGLHRRINERRRRRC